VRGRHKNDNDLHSNNINKVGGGGGGEERRGEERRRRSSSSVIQRNANVTDDDGRDEFTEAFIFKVELVNGDRKRQRSPDHQGAPLVV